MSNEESEPDVPIEDVGLVERTEEMAKRAIQKLRMTATSLPRVREEATRAAEFFRSIDTLGLRLIAALYLLAAVIGTSLALVGVEPVGALPDWFMHLAMYVVCFALLAVYIRAHRRRRKIARFLFCGLAVLGFVCFAFLLVDRIPARVVFLDSVQGGRTPNVLREAMPLFWLPAVMLWISALSLFAHWAYFNVYSRASVPSEY